MPKHRWERLDRGWDTEEEEEKEEKKMDRPIACLRKRFQIKNRFVVNLISEFFCTALLLLLGTGISLQFAVKSGQWNSFMQTMLAWSFAVTIAVYSTLYTSGAHMNPAISFVFFTFGRLPFKWFLAYFPVQVLGAFFGTALSYHVYADEFQHFTAGERLVSGVNATAPIFTTFPAEHISNYTAFIDQTLGTALLMLVVAMATDPRNKIPVFLLPILIGMTVFTIVSGYSVNVGCPINPARDLGPRIFLLFAGYGWESFSWHGYYFWIPIVAPIFGATLGGWIYQVCVAIHIPDDPEPLPPDSRALIKNGRKTKGSEFDPLNADEP